MIYFVLLIYSGVRYVLQFLKL